MRSKGMRLGRTAHEADPRTGHATPLRRPRGPHAKQRDATGARLRVRPTPPTAPRRQPFGGRGVSARQNLEIHLEHVRELAQEGD